MGLNLIYLAPSRCASAIACQSHKPSQWLVNGKCVLQAGLASVPPPVRVLAGPPHARLETRPCHAVVMALPRHANA
jgi:hypothetical protein